MIMICLHYNFSSCSKSIKFCSTLHRRLYSIQRPKKYVETPSGYDPQIVERDWMQFWSSNNFFNPKQFSKSKFVCLPPPNVTGDLHIGHALTVAIEDTFVRWRRMMGDSVIWIPGFDHAGIATQIVVENWLYNEKGLKRLDLSREKFIEYCIMWKEQRISNIQNQLNRLGASLDFQRSYYTMDENFSHAVNHAFCTLYNEGLIFRDERLVNWSPYLQSTLSDIEISSLEIDEPKTISLPDNEKVDVGWIYHVKYDCVEGRKKSLTVATTRPETILADRALAVHPADLRYSNLIGMYCRNPLLPANFIPVIADEKVDPHFGTGVLKITPGHDKLDYEIGIRHNLDILNVFNDNGKCKEECGVQDISGKTRFEARHIALKILESRGNLISKHPHKMSIPLCSRTGDIVESMPKSQWFLNCRQMAQNVIGALNQDQFKIYPEFQKAQMKRWLEKTEDWCLSRQLWWGHRIPAYKVAGKFIVQENYRLIQEKFPEEEVVQDSDVLDTWFSSALVPLVVRGWPKMDLKLSQTDQELLLDLMETGHDILGFWVTRMAMLGLHFSGRVPFKNILLHGIVRDAQGRKMSKSLGNVIDPIDVIEGKSLLELQERIGTSNLPPEEKVKGQESIAKNFPKGISECGADALRLTLLSNDVQSITMNVDVSKIQNRRRFCNKIWQGVKFMQIIWKDGIFEPIQSKNDKDYSKLSNEDKWMLSRLAFLIKNVNKGLESLDFHQSSIALFNFWWHELCDVYFEYCKLYTWENNYDPNRAELIGRVLATVADNYIRLSAPFMPFLMEELDQKCARKVDNVVSVHERKFPTLDQFDLADPDLDQDLKTVMDIVGGVRSLRKEFGISNKTPIESTLVCDSKTKNAIERFFRTLSAFVNASIRMDLKLEFFTLNNLGLNDHIYYLINENCQIYVKMNDLERERAIGTIKTQMGHRQKALSYAIYKQKRCEQLNKANPKVTLFDNSEEIDRLTQEIERLCLVCRNFNR